MGDVVIEKGPLGRASVSAETLRGRVFLRQTVDASGPGGLRIPNELVEEFVSDLKKIDDTIVFDIR